MPSNAGIPAKYAGKCAFCGGAYGVGDLIDRPSRESKEWGHPACALDAARGANRDQYHAPAVNGGHAQPASSAATADILFDLGVALTESTKGVLAAAVALKKLARLQDPTVESRFNRE